MKTGPSVCWLLVTVVLALVSAQCHNNPCQQTNFRDYSSCIQGSCASTCQCGAVTCGSCATSDPCCDRCCAPSPCSSCQGSSCPSNCPTTCPSAPPRTCNDINCRTCRREECMGCCDARTTTRQSGQPVTPSTPVFRPCNVTNIFKPNITMPNITITINQPPIHITTGPVLNNITVPCPHPGHVTCPNPKTNIIVVPTNNTNCCRVRDTRCIHTSNPMRPHCYQYYQPACGPRCHYQPPTFPVPMPQPPEYYPVYIPQPQPQPQPVYTPQYIPMPIPQPLPAPCPTSECPEVQQPQYPYYLPYPSTGQQAGCVGQFPYLYCPPDVMYNQLTGGIPVTPLDGQVVGAAPLPYPLATNYNNLPVVNGDSLQTESLLGLRSGERNITRFVVVKNKTNDNEDEDEEDDNNKDNV